MFLLILVVVCYTICSLSDKYAVSTAKFNGDELGFLMAAATAVFMACCLPFLDRTITLSWQSFAAIGLLCLSKILEFKLSAIILDEISAFELKAWLGITLFMSYATDIFLGEKPSIFKFLFIVLTVAGLVFIAKSGRTDSGNINYRRIVVPLVFYLLARYGYGIERRRITYPRPWRCSLRLYLWLSYFCQGRSLWRYSRKIKRAHGWSCLQRFRMWQVCLRRTLLLL